MSRARRTRPVDKTETADVDPDALRPVPTHEQAFGEPLDEGPSKSQLKRDSHALQALGARLIELPAEKLRRMDLPLNLLEAIEMAQRITAREGRRRQLQYVGKLMRSVDADAIRAQIEVDGQQHRLDTAIMHAAERWRDTLVQAPERLGEFIERYPLAAARPLGATLKAAIAEDANNQRGRRYRDLFRQLRDIMSESNV
jgi:ribosome-associated protein